MSKENWTISGLALTLKVDPCCSKSFIDLHDVSQATSLNLEELKSKGNYTSKNTVFLLKIQHQILILLELR
jgi:hypothetical protein